MAAERELIPEEEELAPLSPLNSFVDLKGRLVFMDSSTTALPKGEIVLFEKPTIPEPITAKKVAKGAGKVAGTAVSGLLSLELLMGGMATADNLKAWQDAKQPDKVFVDQMAGKFRIGASFSPEQYGINLNNMNTEWGKENYKRAVDSLKRIINDMHVTDMRIGIRWDNVLSMESQFTSSDSEDTYDFSFYKPFLDILFENNVNVTINVGDKVERWEEHHQPAKYTPLLEKESVGDGVIDPQDPISPKIVDYETAFWKWLKETYNPKDLRHIKTLQLENEPFNRFGVDPATISEKQIINEVLNAESEMGFLQPNYVINSAAFLQLDPAIDTWATLLKDHPEFKGRLDVSVNNYAIDMGSVNVPIIGDVNPLRLPVIERVDPGWYADTLANRYQAAIQRCENICHIRRVEEAQAEPWDGKPTLPGDPVENFKYVIIRSNEILDYREKEKVIYVWGIEYLERTDTDAAKKIEDMINQINLQYPAK